MTTARLLVGSSRYRFRRLLMTEASTAAFQPLQGLRCLDLSSVIAGPWAAMQLADLGAEVIKVEVPRKGDDSRHFGPPFLQHLNPQDTSKTNGQIRTSTHFLCQNRNKKSVTINLKSPRGLDLALKLAETSDIIVENHITGKLDKMGFGYEQVSKRNPKIIYCSVSGYGRTGSFATAAGYDAVVGGEAGLTRSSGFQNELPVRVATPVTDEMTGMNAVGAILAALISRRSTGQGCHIDSSMFDVQASAISYQATSYLNCGYMFDRMGNADPFVAPSDMFETKDGSIMLAIHTDEEFEALSKVLECPHWITKYATNDIRMQQSEQLKVAIQEKLKAKSTSDVIEQFTRYEIAAGRVNNMEQMSQHPQALARDLIEDTVHPKYGRIKIVRPPVMYNRKRLPTRLLPPGLGEHNEEIFSELGISKNDIQKLHADEVI